MRRAEAIATYGNEPGVRLRGWHPKPMSWRRVKRTMQRKWGIGWRSHRLPGGGVYRPLEVGANHPLVLRLLGEAIDRRMGVR